MTIGFPTVLIVTALLFSLGVFAILTRTNIVAILLGIELVLNASALNVVAFARLHGTPIEGQLMGLFIIMLAASEAAIAFGILINFYRNLKSVEVTSAQRMRQ